MTPIDQRIFDSEGFGKDCWKCCVASILELPYESVPDLMGDDQDKETIAFLATKDLYLNMGGLASLKTMKEEFFIACGLSPRCKGKEKRVYHAVVATLKNDMVKIVHDPHPSRKGLWKGPQFFYWISKQ